MCGCTVSISLLKSVKEEYHLAHIDQLAAGYPKDTDNIALHKLFFYFRFKKNHVEQKQQLPEICTLMVFATHSGFDLRDLTYWWKKGGGAIILIPSL